VVLVNLRAVFGGLGSESTCIGENGANKLAFEGVVQGLPERFRRPERMSGILIKR
jgi:hypothetical protein